MLDFRLKVFATVAKRLSFTKASQELYISQPAVTKHIQELEQQFSTKLFTRNGTSIDLTLSGKILLEKTNQIFEIYRETEFEINKVNNKLKGNLKIGASTTIAQYILPEILVKFHSYYEDIHIDLTSQNTEKISDLLKKNKIDIGIIEGPFQSPQFDYIPLMLDEIVLVARVGHPLSSKTLSVKDLAELDFVSREKGSGTQDFIDSELQKSKLLASKLHVIMNLDSTESIKNYLAQSDAMAFLSVSSITNELKYNKLNIIDIKHFEIKRQFQFIVLKGEQSELVRLFMKTCGIMKK